MREGSVLKEAEGDQDEDSGLVRNEVYHSCGQRFGVLLRTVILWTENYKGEKSVCCWKTSKLKSRGERYTASCEPTSKMISVLNHAEGRKVCWFNGETCTQAKMQCGMQDT